MSKAKKLWTLFITTFSISAMTSGGYAIVSVMKKKFVEGLNWLEEDEMLDLTAIAQSSPGPIAINASILVGYRICGFIGALVTVLGTVLPPLIIMTLVTIFYEQFCTNKYIRFMMRGMQAGVAAMLVDVAIGLFSKQAAKKNAFLYALMLISFLIYQFTDVSVFVIAFICAAGGIIKVYIETKKVKNNEH